MIQIFLTAFFSAIVAVGFFEAIKEFFPKIPKIAKTIIGLVIEILVALAFFAITALPTWAIIVTGVITTIAFAELGYKYLVKLVAKIKELIDAKK